MINKKRLAMMALAASMVLPTNLTYFSVATPVLAQEATSPITNDSFKDPEDNTKTKLLALDTGSYELGASLDIVNSIVIKQDAIVTLDLKTYNITSTSPTLIYLYPGAQLTVKGTGTIKYTGSSNGAIFNLSGAGNKLTLEDGITLESVTTGDDILDVHGVAILPAAKNSEVTIGKATIKTATGISVNGLIDTSGTDSQGNTYDYTLGSDKAPKVTLNETEINVPFTGIYQAGVSEFILNKAKITSTTEGAAIETRAGDLTVNGGEITGNLRSPLVTTPNGNGATTFNAGIAVAQHTTDKPINITIDQDEDENGAKITGWAALAILDPQNKQTEAVDEDIVIDVNEATLTGAEDGFDVAYTTDTILFTLTNTTLKNNTIQKVKKDQVTSAEEDIDPDKVPYTVITQIKPDKGLPSSVLEDIAKPSEDDPNQKTLNVSFGEEDEDSLSFSFPLDSLKDNEGNIQNLTTTILTNALTDQSQEAVAGTKLEDSETEEPAAPNYIYTIEGLDTVEASKDGISVQGTPTVKIQLQNESVIKFLLPATSNDEEVDEEKVQFEAGDTTTAKYVEVSKLLNGTSVTEAKINQYFASQNLKVAEGALTNSLSTQTPLTVFGKNPDVTLDENKFIEIQLDSGVGNTTEPGTIGGGSHTSKPKPKPEEPMEPVVGTPTTMYRLYNRLTGEHLYTIDKNERDNLLTSDTWKDEGEGWIAPSVSDYPVYRLLNPNNGDHHYTTDKNEFDTLPTLGWIAEGVAFFSADKDNPENVHLHRLYNPNAEGAGSHHYTADINERDTLVSQGWKYEGLAWAGLPANK